MSKRKAVSDDDEPIMVPSFLKAPPSKKKKFTLIRPRIHVFSSGSLLFSKYTKTRRAGSSTSRLKLAPTVAASLPQPSPTQSATVTPVETSTPRRNEINYAGQAEMPTKLDSESSPSHSSANVGSETQNDALSHEMIVPEPTPATDDSSHSCLALEQKVDGLEKALDGLKAALENFFTQDEERRKSTDMKLGRLIELMTQGGIIQPTAPNSGQPVMFNTTSTASEPETGIVFVNPQPAPGLMTLVSRVVAEHPSRVGAKKSGVRPKRNSADTKSFKGHTRTTFYEMIAISNWKEIPPFFIDDKGKPDLFPFKDPKTGYCQPFPNWELPLTKQIAWVPTFMFRFKATIPNDGSAVSAKLRGLSEERILQLMHDGPFRTGRSHWRAMRKTNDQLEEMRLAVRQERATTASEDMDDGEGEERGGNESEEQSQSLDSADSTPQSVEVGPSRIPELGSSQATYLPPPNRIANSMSPLSHIPVPLPAEEVVNRSWQEQDRAPTYSTTESGSSAYHEGARD